MDIGVGQPQPQRPRRQAPSTRRPVVGRPGTLPVSAAHQLVVIVSFVLAAFVAVSSILLPLPWTVIGHDARLLLSGLGVVVGIPAAARVLAPAESGRSAVALLIAGPLLMSAPWWAGYRPDGQGNVAWWAFTVCGAALTVLAVAGIVLYRQDRARRRELTLSRQSRRGATPG